MILDKIYSHKLNEVDESKRFIPMETLKERCKGSPGTRKFSEALKRTNGIDVIAEVKKASPSAGIIKVSGVKTRADVLRLEEAGIDAILNAQQRRSF